VKLAFPNTPVGTEANVAKASASRSPPGARSWLGKAGTVAIGVTLGGHDLHVLAKNPHQRVDVRVKLRFTRKRGAPLTAYVRLLMG
jgi:hypothetical protein